MRLLLALVGLTIVAIVVVVLVASSRSPAWYAPPPPDDPDATALAELVEHRLVEEVQRIRPEEERWTLRVTEEQVNAWLATRLPRWIDGRPELAWPEGLGVPQVSIGADGVQLAAPWRPEGALGGVLHGVLRGRVRIDAGENGMPVVRVEDLGLGAVPVPGGLPASAFEQVAESAAARDALAHLRAVLGAPQPLGDFGDEDGTFPIADGRRLSIESVRFEERTLRVTSRTLPAREAPPGD